MKGNQQMKNAHCKFAIVAGALTLLTIAIPLAAHHGTGISYDTAKRFEVKAVITEFRYSNPHPQLFFDVTDEKGNVAHWTAEMGTDIQQLQRAGWTRARSLEALKAGAVVTLLIYPSKAGGPFGLIRGAKNEKGQSIMALDAALGAGQ
jgi:hypothetical protein